MKYKILLILFIISLISSLTLSIKPVSEICNIESGCELVQHSSYSEIFGTPTSHYGVFIFSFLILLTISQIIKPTHNKKLLINLSVLIGSIIAIYFLYLQKFVLGAYCKYCLIVDFSLIIALFLIFPDLEKDLPKILKKLK